MALYLGLSLLFLEFSVLPQVAYFVLHVNLYLPYLIGIPAIVAMILDGGIGKSFRARTAYYWMGFACWMTLAAPFSSWPGGSVAVCFNYWRITLVMLFVTAGIIVKWSDVRKVMNVIAAAAVINVLCGRLFRSDMGERVGIALGSIGNPNDYAGHLLLVLPFLVWILLTGKVFWRMVALATVGCGLYLILATASRGALVALGADLLLFVIMGTGRQKAALFVLGPITAMLLLAIVPSTSWRRLTTVWSSSINSAEAEEATASSAAREYTLRTSIRYALAHPVFGVGPNQFADYEGGHEQVMGAHGYYHEAHNSYTQVAAECGIPAFLFFVAGTVSSLLLLFKTFRQARRRPDCQDIRIAVFCMILGVFGFDIAITFLNFAYFFYLPAIAGLATGVWVAAQREFQARDAVLQAGTT